MQQYLGQKPFEIYGLHLFHLVVKHRSFTRAAREAGLSPSALTRQIQNLEEKIGLSLLNRTTRSVEPTEAGSYLAIEAQRLAGDVSSILDGLQSNFLVSAQQVRVGVSRSLAMAHMPGLFFANQRRQPSVSCSVLYKSSPEILTSLDLNDLDVGVLSAPRRLPDSVRVTHRFKDQFVLIADIKRAQTVQRLKKWESQKAALREQPWLLFDKNTFTGQALNNWMKRQGLLVESNAELDSFDLIINLVLSGLGIAWVPRRALALYRRKQGLVEIECPETFCRDVVAIVRKNRQLPVRVSQYIDNILF
jgi:DNA-binding transcriptional LysR family regulator